MFLCKSVLCLFVSLVLPLDYLGILKLLNSVEELKSPFHVSVVCYGRT